MNQGVHPVEISRRVKLPPSMASHPYLQEHYPNIAWTTRNIYAGHFGWFSGTDLLELSPVLVEERARRLVSLVGKENMVKEARKALTNGDLWWSIELSTHLLRCEEDSDTRAMFEQAMRRLAEQQLSSHARAAFLTFARRDWDIKKATYEPRMTSLTHLAPALFTVLKVNNKLLYKVATYTTNTTFVSHILLYKSTYTT